MPKIENHFVFIDFVFCQYILFQPKCSNYLNDYNKYLFVMALSKEAQEAKPKKPQNAYMRFRLKRLKELGDVEKKNDLIKKEWNSLSEE